ncbi:hypothetical protein [Devosia naphthalenivorans]|uniref:hypothetical protein n=1 Tax=Devosia naphthalenivorans TaxID=2082392 RepID=UPI000D3AC12B|nr:hypothetical protein [Devosia naphthalenivorans]
MQSLRIAEDRGMVVPSGATVCTGYVPTADIIMACRDRMAIGDVERSMQRRMACAPDQPWPCPVGEWRGDRFAIFDGRHEFIAALMLGVEHVLVAWIVTPASS